MNTINMNELLKQIKQINKDDLQKVLDCCMTITSLKSGITCDIAYLIQLAEDYATIEEINYLIEEEELSYKKFALILIGAINLIQNKNKNYRLKNLLDDSISCNKETKKEKQDKEDTTSWGTPTLKPEEQNKPNIPNPFL